MSGLLLGFWWPWFRSRPHLCPPQQCEELDRPGTRVSGVLESLSGACPVSPVPTQLPRVGMSLAPAPCLAAGHRTLVAAAAAGLWPWPESLGVPWIRRPTCHCPGDEHCVPQKVPPLNQVPGCGWLCGGWAVGDCLWWPASFHRVPHVPGSSGATPAPRAVFWKGTKSAFVLIHVSGRQHRPPCCLLPPPPPGLPAALGLCQVLCTWPD